MLQGDARVPCLHSRVCGGRRGFLLLADPPSATSTAFATPIPVSQVIAIRCTQTRHAPRSTPLPLTRRRSLHPVHPTCSRSRSLRKPKLKIESQIICATTVTARPRDRHTSVSASSQVIGRPYRSQPKVHTTGAQTRASGAAEWSTGKTGKTGKAHAPRQAWGPMGSSHWTVG